MIKTNILTKKAKLKEETVAVVEQIKLHPEIKPVITL